MKSQNAALLDKISSFLVHTKILNPFDSFLLKFFCRKNTDNYTKEKLSFAPLAILHKHKQAGNYNTC